MRAQFIAILLLLILLVATLANPGIIYLIHAHGPDGKQEIEINVQEISSIRQPRENTEGHLAEGVHCLVYMTNGAYVPTFETCLEIVKKIAALDQPNPEKHP